MHLVPGTLETMESVISTSLEMMKAYVVGELGGKNGYFYFKFLNYLTVHRSVVSRSVGCFRVWVSCSGGVCGKR